MGNAIVEYIGRSGVKCSSSDSYQRYRRFEVPRPGDVIIWDDGLEYPFNKSCKRGTFYGRIDGFGKWKDDEYHICVEPGSVFLYENSVSISGGPFTCVKPEELKPTYSLKLVRFWNWGNNSPGANQGVDYFIERPVFQYVPIKKEGGDSNG